MKFWRLELFQNESNAFCPRKNHYPVRPWLLLISQLTYTWFPFRCLLAQFEPGSHCAVNVADLSNSIHQEVFKVSQNIPRGSSFPWMSDRGSQSRHVNIIKQKKIILIYPIRCWNILSFILYRFNKKKMSSGPDFTLLDFSTWIIEHESDILNLLSF